MNAASAELVAALAELDGMTCVRDITEPGRHEIARRINTSGIIPLDHRVLIKQDEAEKITSGGIILPESEVDKQKYAMTSATVIAVGSLAWAEAKHDADRFGVDFNAPVPGSRIKVGKYAGTRYDGEDGTEYTMVNDDDVIGLLVAP